jgi:predicted ATPase
MENQLPYQSKPFVGRQKELLLLGNNLSWVIMNKKPRIVFIHGDFGVGKTTLVENFLQAAEHTHQNVLVGKGKCSYEDQENGRVPFTQVLNGLVNQQKEGINGKRLLNWIKDVAPGWVDFLTIGLASPIVTTIDKSIELFRGTEPSKTIFMEKQIFMQFTNAIHELTQSRDAILFIDDLHWADESSLKMIFHLMNNLVDRAVMVVCTYRTYDIQNSPHASVFNTIHHNLLYKSLAFDDIELDKGIDVLSYANDRYGKDTIPTSVLEAIQQKSDGLPIFVVELFNLWEQKQFLQPIGQIGENKLSWQLVTDVDLILPAGIMELLKERVSLLSSELKNIITGASVEGEDFSAQTIEKLFSVDRMLLFDDLSALERKFNLIKEKGSEQISTELFDFYRFAHRFIREYIYNNEIPPAKRREMHLRLGECLEAIFQDRSPVASQIARHFREAKVFERAVDYMFLAARYEARRFSWAECQNWCRQGLSIISTLKGKRLELKIEFLEQLAECFDSNLRYQEAVAAFTEAIQLAESLNIAPEKILHLYALLSDTYEQMEDFENLHDVIAKGKRLIKAHKIAFGEARININIGEGLLKVRQGKLDSAIRILEQSVEDAKKVKQDPVGKKLLAGALNCLAVAYSFRGDYKNSVKHYQSAVHLVEASGDINLQAYYLVNMIDDLYWLTDNSDKLRLSILEAKKLVYQIGDIDSESYLLSVEGKIYLRNQEYQAAEIALNQAIHIWSRLNADKLSASAYADLAMVYLETGHKDKALANALKAVELASHDIVKGYCLDALAIVEFQTDDQVNSLSHFQEAIDMLEDDDALHLAALAQRHYADALIKIGKKKDALEVLGKALTRVRGLGLEREERIIKEQIEHILVE